MMGAVVACKAAWKTQLRAYARNGSFAHTLRSEVEPIVSCLRPLVEAVSSNHDSSRQYPYSYIFMTIVSLMLESRYSF